MHSPHRTPTVVPYSPPLGARAICPVGQRTQLVYGECVKAEQREAALPFTAIDSQYTDVRVSDIDGVVLAVCQRMTPDELREMNAAECEMPLQARSLDGVWHSIEWKGKGVSSSNILVRKNQRTSGRNVTVTRFFDGENLLAIEIM